MSEVTIQNTTVKTIGSIEVRKSVWTGPVYIKPGFGRQGGYATRSRTSWTLYVGGEFRSSYTRRSQALKAAERLASKG